MEPKPEKFPHVTLIREFAPTTGTLEEIRWESSEWSYITRFYADTFQRDVLRAVTVAGISYRYRRTVFSNIYKGVDKWEVVNKNWFENREQPTWHQLCTMAIATNTENIRYPDKYPYRLVLSYGYTQQQYLSDLKEYWNDLAPEYYQPWDNTHIGYDTVVSDTIQYLNQETQTEIEQLIQAAKLVLHVVNNGGSHDNKHQDKTNAESVR